MTLPLSMIRRPPRAQGGMTTPARALVSTDATGFDHAVELTRGLAEARVAVVLAVLGPRPDDPGWTAASAIPGARVVHAPFRVDGTAECWSEVAAAGQWLLALEQEHGCEVVHLGAYAHG